MSLADDIRDAIGIAHDETLDLQPKVEHRAWAGEKTDGEVLYDSTMRTAIVERKQQLVTDTAGNEVTSTAYIGFLEEIKPHGAEGRTEPIDPRDMFVLPDGTVGAVKAVDGFFDAGTGVPFYSQVYLG